MPQPDSFDEGKSAIAELALAIFRGSLSCVSALKRDLNYPKGAEEKERCADVSLEFIYFYVYMAGKVVLSQFGDEKKGKIYDQLSPLIVHLSIDPICGNWALHLKIGTRNEFYEKLNQKESEYSSCKELISEDKPFTGSALFPTLGRKIAGFYGYPNDPETIMAVIELAKQTWKVILLEKLVEAATAEL